MSEETTPVWETSLPLTLTPILMFVLGRESPQEHQGRVSGYLAGAEASDMERAADL